MIPVIDMHCDTLTRANMHFKHDIYRLHLEQIDVMKLVNGGVRVQFFAICLPKLTTISRLGRLYEGDWKHIRRLTGILHHTCRLHPDQIGLCQDAADMDRLNDEGRIAAILTIEDGRDIRGDMRRLFLYHRLGVRLVTLTWNFPNCFGLPNNPYRRKPTAEEMNKGLTSFGKEAVEVMNHLKMLIDVSHLSDGGFWDVANCSKVPFVASHSNCRAICNHTRNLTDAQIKMIGERGGVIGLNQYPRFLRIHSRHSTMDDCLKHLIHMRDVGGIDCVALGADFDGCPPGFRMSIQGPQEYPVLADAMLRHGFSESEVEKVFYKNVERVIRECL